jgi:AraC family transcriptional regulator of adaptative response/methylated-DNA-[protein]-cysteine methyltransferase
MMLMGHLTDQIEARRTDIPAPPSFAHAAEDYDCVRRALAYLSEHWREQPDVEAVACAVGLSTDGLTVLFRRWAGLTPKTFLQAITLDRARKFLRDLDAAYEVGLSGPGRLHDLFVTHEAMSPGEWKTGGAGSTPARSEPPW